MPVPLIWELKWGKIFARGVVGPRTGQRGNGMRRLSSGKASVCGKWRESSLVGGGERAPQPWVPQAP